MNRGREFGIIFTNDLFNLGGKPYYLKCYRHWIGIKLERTRGEMLYLTRKKNCVTNIISDLTGPETAKGNGKGNEREEGAQITLGQIKKVKSRHSLLGFYLMAAGWEEIVLRIVKEAQLGKLKQPDFDLCLLSNHLLVVIFIKNYIGDKIPKDTSNPYTFSNF